MNNVGITMKYGITFPTMFIIAVMFALETDKENLPLINLLLNYTKSCNLS